MAKKLENDSELLNTEANNESISELSLEDAFDKIDELMNEMSDSDIPLEKSFELYKQGMELLKHCNEKIEKVEKQVIELSGADYEG